MSSLDYYWSLDIPEAGVISFLLVSLVGATVHQI
jgi:hypothetical protein